MGRFKTTTDACQDAITLAKLFLKGDVEDATDVIMTMSMVELRACLAAQSGYHACAVLRASQLVGYPPEAIFDAALPGMKLMLREQGVQDGD